MLSRFAMLAFAGILAFSPAVHLSMTNDRGVLLLCARLDGIGTLTFIFDPGAGDFITTYASERLGRKPAYEITLGEATFRGPFPVLSGDPEQLDPQHDPGSDGFGLPTIAAAVDGYAGRFEIDVREHALRERDAHAITIGRYRDSRLSAAPRVL